MDERSFDGLTRLFGSRGRDRRWVFKAVGTTVAALAAGTIGPASAADAAACGSEGDPCRRRGDCCSGLCQGPKGKRRCRARGVGTCQQGEDSCRANPDDVPRCNGKDFCGCFVTTGGSSFCGTGGDRARCRSDADCVARGFPKGSACIEANRGICGENCAELSGTACVLPCSAGQPIPNSETTGLFGVAD